MFFYGTLLNMRESKAFTLIELLIVLMVVGVLASIALPSFARAKERALNDQARALVQQLYNAEKMRVVEGDVVVACAGAAACRAALGVDIAASDHWFVQVTGVNAAATPQTFTVSVCRGAGCGGASPRRWTLTEAGGTPDCTPNGTLCFGF